MWFFFVGDSTQRELAGATVQLIAALNAFEVRCQDAPHSHHADWDLELRGRRETFIVSFRFVRGLDTDKWAQLCNDFHSLLPYVDVSNVTSGSPWRCDCTERNTSRATSAHLSALAPGPDVVVANIGLWALPSVAASRTHHRRPLRPAAAVDAYFEHVPHMFGQLAASTRLPLGARVLWRETYCFESACDLFNASSRSPAQAVSLHACAAFNELVGALVTASRATTAAAYRAGTQAGTQAGRHAGRHAGTQAGTQPPTIAVMHTHEALAGGGCTIRGGATGHPSWQINVALAAQLLLQAGAASVRGAAMQLGADASDPSTPGRPARLTAADAFALTRELAASRRPGAEPLQPPRASWQSPDGVVWGRVRAACADRGR